jgi:predicted MFS family arabinose efflux permease
MRAHRPLPEAGAGSDTAPAPPSRPGGATTIIRDPRLLSLAGLIWLYGFYIAPEGLAAPYAHQLGAGTVAVGLLMAADPLGAALGTYVFTRLLSPAARPRIVGALAVLAGIPLVLSAVHPLLPITFLLWTVSGFLSSHTILAQAMFVQLVPDHRRGRAVGMLTAGLQTVQGLGVILAGAVAELFEPSVTVALCGGAGATCAVLAALAWHRARTRTVMRD